MDRATFEALSEAEQVAQVLATMAEIVAEVGDEYSYQREHCQYVCVADDPDRRLYSHTITGDLTLAPSCFIGAVLARLGWALDTLKQSNGGHIDGAPFARRLHPATVAVLTAAQRHQDGSHAYSNWHTFGLTADQWHDKRWSTALHLARHEAQRLGYGTIETVQ